MASVCSRDTADSSADCMRKRGSRSNAQWMEHSRIFIGGGGLGGVEGGEAEAPVAASRWRCCATTQLNCVGGWSSMLSRMLMMVVTVLDLSLTRSWPSNLHVPPLFSIILKCKPFARGKPLIIYPLMLRSRRNLKSRYLMHSHSVFS